MSKLDKIANDLTAQLERYGVRNVDRGALIEGLKVELKDLGFTMQDPAPPPAYEQRPLSVEDLVEQLVAKLGVQGVSSKGMKAILLDLR